MDEMFELRQFLSSISVGPISDEGVGRELENLVAKAWDEFAPPDGGMKGYKALGRLEEINWNPPILNFTIERHGGLCQGSSRSELQSWALNLDTLEAGFSGGRFRQTRAMKPKLLTEPLAEEIAMVIGAVADDPSIKWMPNGNVRILVGEIIPSDGVAKQTLTWRRRRFRNDLKLELEKIG